MTDLVIVSMHEKGFPQADFYSECGDMSASEFEAIGMAPDDYFTLRRGDTIKDAIARAIEHWPGARIVEADDEETDSEDT